MKTETITEFEGESLIYQANGAPYKEWQELKQLMMRDDQLVRYSDVVVRGGWASGEQGIALLRSGEVVAKIVLAIIG